MNSTVSAQRGHDARGVANLMVRRAREMGVTVTNLALQKLVYFAHGWMLSRHGRPLVDGYFEAWQHGPVHPVLYANFKDHGRGTILSFAQKRDLMTGTISVAGEPTDPEALEVIDRVLQALGHQSTSQLVNLSHAKGGPWDEVVNKRPTETRLGLRIPDILISERYHRHMVMVGSEDRIGEIVDESPPARDRLGTDRAASN